ncbi:S-layer homology domain-containing protein [Candidatus Peregrinibacteria bacterium]|nr:S-layer homology domain-containing protein [Candidatus Peregrinibacteria bacterium]
MTKNIFKGVFLFFLVFVSFSTAFAYCGDSVLKPPQEQCDDGNFVNRDGCDSYCKIEDMTPPTLSSSSPVNGTTGIPTDIHSISLLFSEALDPKTVNTNTIQLKYGGEALSIAVSLKEDGKTVLISPRQSLFSEKKHSLYTQGVADASGNQQTIPIIILFTTAKAVDREPPPVVLDPPPGKYNVGQVITMTAYLDKRVFINNIDPTAKIYYTLNGLAPTKESPIYKKPFTLRSNTTVKYFSEDSAGNTTAASIVRYTFGCPDLANAKTISSYPSCKIKECIFGFSLFSNTCIAQLDAKSMSADPFASAVTAPLLPSSTPLFINSKPAIRFTDQHQGTLTRPIIFQDVVRGTTVNFVSGTKIATADHKPFVGYVTPPENLYSKDFPIHFGYTFKSIFSFFAPDKTVLFFDPFYQITLPITDIFEDQAPITVFSYNPSLEKYTPFPDDRVAIDWDKRTIRISSDHSDYFFVAQPGAGFNQVYFQDTIGHWAQNYAELLYRKGIVKGKAKGIFSPEDKLTRAEFVKIVLAALGATIPREDEVQESLFADVPLDAWYAPYIQKAASLKLIQGYSNRTFKPDAPINRAEAIKMAVTAFGFKIDALSELPVSRPFPDIESNAWYTPSVLFVIKNDLLAAPRDRRTGIPGKIFSPGRPITRAEMAELTIKALGFKASLE